jgi:hypothetical protein
MGLKIFEYIEQDIVRTRPAHWQCPCSSILSAPHASHHKRRCHHRSWLATAVSTRTSVPPPQAPRAAPAGPQPTPFNWRAPSWSPTTPIFSSTLTRAATTCPWCFLHLCCPTTLKLTPPPSRLPVNVCSPPTAEHRCHSKESEPPPWFTVPRYCRAPKRARAEPLKLPVRAESPSTTEGLSPLVNRVATV